MIQSRTTGSGNASGSVAWIVGAALAAMVLALAVFYRRFLLSGLDLVGEATGGRISAALCLMLGLVVLVWLLVWLLFPFFVYFGFKGLRRQMSELNLTVEQCAQQLDRVRPGELTAKTDGTPLLPRQTSVEASGTKVTN